MPPGQDHRPGGVAVSVAANTTFLAVPRRWLRHRIRLLLLAALTIGLLPILAAAPAPVHLATVPVASSPWLDRFNAWRANANVPSVTEDTTFSAGDLLHATYMVQTGDVAHSENPAFPQYTVAGNTAAQNSNIFVSSTTATTDVQAIDWWMGAPFHAMAMMDPRLVTTGFGSYRNPSSPSPWQMGAAVNVGQGMTAGGTYPVYFPGNLSTEPLTTYSGNETPNPQLACSGATGLPLFIEVGANVNTAATAATLIPGGGAPLANCVIDSTNPTFASYLKWRGGVIVFPQQPLQNGVTYTVALTVNSVPYTWSFTVGPLLSVTSVSPTAGPMAGGTTVTINGFGFTTAISVKFGATAAASFTPVSDTQVTAVSPAHAVGPVDVTVTTALSTSPISSADVFMFTGPPGPPVNVTATTGNLSATITWSPPASDGGSAITSYTVTSSPGGVTSTVSGSTFTTVVSGLTQGANYTFTVVATNSNGPGTSSAPSNQITVITVPSAPTNVTATAAGGSATVSWSAPPDGGGAIKGYVVTPYANGVAGTPVTFNQPNQMEALFGLTNGVTYTFTVAAFNVAGSGPGSSPSNGVVPNSSLRQPSAQGPSSVAVARPPASQSSPAPSPPPR
ncbi:MAG TPA: fibronectin type III domain-containing protein [Candidatus Dormibacteraeota bacterium]|nr:fibronectin type III domain-containing protein [Candidatus Dormibacteraeota bacterium]